MPTQHEELKPRVDEPKAPEPGAFQVMHWGVVAGTKSWREGETIHVGALDPDQIRHLLDQGAIAPLDAVPPRTVASTRPVDASTVVP